MISKYCRKYTPNNFINFIKKCLVALGLYFLLDFYTDQK